MERPILFSAPMVRAILEGRKTQTRRVIKPQPVMGLSNCSNSPTGWAEKTSEDHLWDCSCRIKIKPHKCPYGKPGERLWVREAFAVHPSQCTTIYRADWAGSTALPDGDIIKWKPSIHMPRRASRITLEITDIRVERLQDITPDDAQAEGVSPVYCCAPCAYPTLTVRRPFYELWESIYGPESWDQNPFVWVIEFKVNKQSEGA